MEAQPPDAVGDVIVRRATSPPSPRQKRFFVGKKLKVETMPVDATPGAPNACAASSKIGTPSGQLGERRRAPEEMDGHDRARPLVTLRAASAGSMFSVTGSMSQNTGVAPHLAIASAVA